MNFYQMPVSEIEHQFNTDITQGLNSNQIEKHYKKFGYNRLKEPKIPSWLILALKQCQSPLIYLLLIAATMMVFLCEIHDAIITLSVVLFNITLSTLQEKRTLSIITQLTKLLATNCLVIRDGKKISIDHMLIVPGDLVVLQEGFQVPADLRLAQANNLFIDESTITGEMESISKSTAPIPNEVRIFEQKNMAFQGTCVMSGTGLGIVVTTGINTYLGSIQRATSTFDTSVPLLQKEFKRMSWWIIASIFFCLAVLAITVCCLTTIGYYMLFSTIIALLVAAVPEGLTTMVTFTLVRGAYAMAQRKFLIKHIQTVATLGQTTAILTDKTGTLTYSELMVTNVYTNHTIYVVTGKGYEPSGTITTQERTLNDQDYTALHKLVLAITPSTTQIYYDQEQKRYHVLGNQTEAALITFVKKLNAQRNYIIPTSCSSCPFKTNERFSAACFTFDNKYYTYVLASPEVLLASNSHEIHVKEALNKLLSQSLRVVGIGEYTSTQPSCNLPPHINIIGLIGMQDSIRDDSIKTIQKAQQLNIDIALVTGDHPTTARLIAQQVAIKSDCAITGEEFAAMNATQKTTLIKKTSVFARFLPAEKLELVKTFQATNAVVAMIGDGVNDAPSLLQADIGIAMGSGTSVAKEAADAIILDNALSTVITAINQGRHIFQTLQRITFYFLTTNASELLVLMGILILTHKLPLLVPHILWMNVVTDGFMDIALALEPLSLNNNAQQKPLTKLFDRHLIARGIFLAAIMTTGTIITFLITLSKGLAYAQTMTLTTLLFFQWFNAWNCRSQTTSLFKITSRNYWLIAATIGVLALQIGANNWRSSQELLHLVPLPITSWLLCIAIASTIIIAEETRKLVKQFIT